MTEDFLMQGVQPLCERLQSLGPVYWELFLEQLLGSWNILNPKGNSCPGGNSAPLLCPCGGSTIRGHSGKRKCKMGTRSESAHASGRIPGPRGNGKPSCRGAHGPPCWSSHAGMSAPSPSWSARTHPLGNASVGSQSACDLLLVVPAVDILDRQVLLLKRCQGRLFHFLAYGLHMVFVRFTENVVFREVPFHSLGGVEPPQRGRSFMYRWLG